MIFGTLFHILHSSVNDILFSPFGASKDHEDLRHILKFHFLLLENASQVFINTSSMFFFY